MFYLMFSLQLSAKIVISAKYHSVIVHLHSGDLVWVTAAFHTDVRLAP